MDALDRMFHVLVTTLRKTNATAPTASFSVADLYQHIIPFRHFRRELGLQSNAEYEMTLMTLLSGERGYLDVDERMRDGLRKELASSSPDASRVREYADAQVSVNAAALPTTPASPSVSATPASTAAVKQPPPTTAGATAATPPSGTAHGCRYCGGELPTGRALNYCPHCGQNLQVRHCPACGAELDAGWRFCVSCGKSVS